MIRPLLALALLLPVAARAHETTRSYLRLERDGARIEARLALAFRDAEVVTWMDENLDGRISWGEARARLPETASYAAARIGLEAGGACVLVPDEAAAGVWSTGGSDYLDLSFAATCPDAAANLTAATTLFQEIDPDHRLFLTSTERGQAATAVLSPGGAPVLIAPEVGLQAAFGTYVRAGIDHLLAGADHLLFLLVLVLPAAAGAGPARGRVLSVVAAVTGFTIAHAVTLTAAATDLLRPLPRLIESLVALSIAVTALDNMRPFIPGPRAALAAFFGTIHGFGFATALSGLTMAGGSFALALFGFNLGIEIAQLGVVLLVFPALAMLRSRWTVAAGSLLALGISLVWLWQRAF